MVFLFHFAVPGLIFIPVVFAGKVGKRKAIFFFIIIGRLYSFFAYKNFVNLVAPNSIEISDIESHGTSGMRKYWQPDGKHTLSAASEFSNCSLRGLLT